MVRRFAVGSIDWLGFCIKWRAQAVWIAVLIASSPHGQAGGSPRDAHCERELPETEQKAATVAPDQCIERQQHKTAERKCREKKGEARREMSDVYTSPRQPANQGEGDGEQAEERPQAANNGDRCNS